MPVHSQEQAVPAIPHVPTEMDVPRSSSSLVDLICPLKPEFVGRGDSCTIEGQVIFMVRDHMLPKNNFSMHLFQAVNWISHELKSSTKIIKNMLHKLLRDELVKKQGQYYLVKGFEWK